MKNRTLRIPKSSTILTREMYSPVSTKLLEDKVAIQRVSVAVGPGVTKMEHSGRHGHK